MRGGHSLGAVLAAVMATVPGVAITAAPTPRGRGEGKPGRVYGAANIKRVLQTQKREYVRGPRGDVWAGHPDTREVARRLRQAEQVRRNRLARAQRRCGKTTNGAERFGLTRRGRYVSI